MASVAPLQGIPALLLRGRKNILCVADLHLGYEHELMGSGFCLPDQTDILLRSLMEIQQGDHLLLLGDIKDSIPAAEKFESLKISRFMRSLQERFSSITVVAGNHDGSIERHLPGSVVLIGSGGIRFSSVGFAHGHSWPSDDVMRSDMLVWGHLHPSIRMYDRLGAAVTMKCWLRGPVHREQIGGRYDAVEVKESILMPSFNHLLMGTPVNEGATGEVSPFTRNRFVVLGEQRAYTLDGVDMGMVSDLVPKRRRGKIK